MKNLFIIAALLLICNAEAQNKRTVGAYTKLDVAGGFDIKLNSNATQISIDSEDNGAVSHIVTEINDGTLKIYMDKGYQPKNWGSIDIEVPFKTLEKVNLTGSGNITSQQTIVSENFAVELTGSGDITLEVNATNVKAQLTGSGDLKVKGKATNFKADVAGSGDLTADGLKCENTKVHVNGSGDAKVHATVAFFARVEGSGEVHFAGHPKTEDSKVSGSGSINKI